MRRRSILMGILAASLACRTAYGACPTQLCDCLGEAVRFGVVAAQKASIVTGKICTPGEYCYDTFAAADDVCATRALLRSLRPSDDAGASACDLTLLAGPGSRAASFRTLKNDPSILADVIVTGGGKVSGLFTDCYSDTTPQIDTTGTNPRLAKCRQAMTDVQSASATLAALTPTQDLGDVQLRGDEFRDITATPGVNVINASRIILRSFYSEGVLFAPRLHVNLDPGTEAVIINTRSLWLEEGSEITEYGGSTATPRVILNVPGPGGRVHIKNAYTLRTPILAPGRTVLTSNLDQGGNVFAKTVRTRGGLLSNAFDACP